MGERLEDLKGYVESEKLLILRAIENFGDGLGDEDTKKVFYEALLQMYKIGAYMGSGLMSLPGRQCHDALRKYLLSKDRKDLPKE